MVLKKFSAKEILKGINQRFEEDSMMEVCDFCKKEKPIPIQRTIKKCDECFEVDIAQEENQKKEAERIARIIAQRIPERYRKFDLDQIEGGIFDFESNAEPGKSLMISGEVGTGKTNYGCQILIYRGQGLFYTISEVIKLTAPKMEALQDASLLMIDDFNKLDVTDQKKLEKVFELLNYRYRECKDTIITSDRTFDEMERHFGEYGAALVSRLRQMMLGVTLKQKWR